MFQQLWGYGAVPGKAPKPAQTANLLEMFASPELITNLVPELYASGAYGSAKDKS